MLPPGLVARFAGARKLVEVGVGASFETALAWRRALPAIELVVTDVSPSLVEGGPPGIVAEVDDVMRPDAELYRGADLVYGVRMPEEIQVPSAKISRLVGARLAVSPLGNEVVDLTEFFPRTERFTADGGRAWWLHSRL